MNSLNVLTRDALRDPINIRKQMAMIELAAKHAREDPAAFFDFVMKDERGNRIRIAPHQVIALDFIMKHQRCVNIWPIGHSKTFLTAALTLWLIGNNPLTRGAIISATQEQAAKPLSMVSDYLLHSHELRVVFPHLRPSTRQRDPWTQTAITVERPPGVRDATLRAIGLDGAILGSRLDWIVFDDILSRENTATDDQRKKVIEWVDLSVMSRLEPGPTAKVVGTNTPWHPEDLVHVLERRGWPTMRMSALGDITVQDDADLVREAREKGKVYSFWNHDGVRMKTNARSERAMRLVAHDPDPDNRTPLWPERFPQEELDRRRRRTVLPEWNRNYLCVARSDDEAMCKTDYIEACKAEARKRGVLGLVGSFKASILIFTGIDLAIKTGEHHDETAFFTFAVLPSGHRQILDIETGRFQGPDIIKKLAGKAKQFGSMIVVETNGCFAPGTLVLTRMRGYVPIEMIRIGEEVWTHKARWRPVTELLKGTAKYLVTARASGSVPVQCTMGHWFWLREAGRTSGRGGGHHRPAATADWISAGFVDREAYVGLAVPKWPRTSPRLQLPCNRIARAKTARVDDSLALVIGLFMAEGHTAGNQTCWTFASKEKHLADFVRGVIRWLLPNTKTSERADKSTRRIIVNSKSLTDALHVFGKGRAKCAPMSWMGWPLKTRLAMVRGWLLGDGCLLTNNPTTTPSRIFVANSISRNWILFARATLLQAGLRPSLRTKAARVRSIAGRAINGSMIYELSINADDSAQLAKAMTSKVESEHWVMLPTGTTKHRSGSHIVHDAQGTWARWRASDQIENETVVQHHGKVFNLRVAEDESFTVEDMIVHNGQDFLRQFALKIDASIPIRAHHTDAKKSHPEYGVASVFIEMANAAWLIPNDKYGGMHPEVEKYCNACLNYVPEKHTADVLMAQYFGRELARDWGVLSGGALVDAIGDGSIAMSIMTR